MEIRSNRKNVDGSKFQSTGCPIAIPTLKAKANTIPQIPKEVKNRFQSKDSRAVKTVKIGRLNKNLTHNKIEKKTNAKGISSKVRTRFKSTFSGIFVRENPS